MTLVFVVEHALMIIKSLLEFSVQYTPDFIKKGEMNRTIISKKLTD